MPGHQYSIPFSKSVLNFSVPPSVRVDLVQSNAFNPLRDTPGAIQDALDHPVGTPPLRELVKKGDRACIVFTDITRASPDQLLVPAILAELEKAGIRNEDITLLCGNGMHRPSSQEEKYLKLGKDIVSRYRVIDNEPQNPAMLVDLGITPNGVPIILHKAAVEADLLVATGIVEPHQYAGYSGGSKTVSIGVAGEKLIAYTHSPAFVDHPGTRLGLIDGNPFHEAIAEAARIGGLRFILNVVLDDDQRVLHVTAGDPKQAFQELVAFAKSIYEVPIHKQYDVVIGGVGYPKDTNLYQASRAPSYLFLAPVSVVRKDGYIIIPARCEEGAGIGIGEQRFFTAMRDAPNVQYILDDARRNGYPPGQQRAFVMAKVLAESNVVIVGCDYPDLVAAAKMIPAKSIEEAIDLACSKVGFDCDLLIVPHALHTLPVIQSLDSSQTR